MNFLAIIVLSFLPKNKSFKKALKDSESEEDDEEEGLIKVKSKTKEEKVIFFFIFITVISNLFYDY